MRIVQISDTHLSRDKPHLLENWASLAAWIADQHPDLVIHTGDVTADGAGVEADLSFSADLMNKLGIRWRAVPGNHDVGDPRHTRQPVNAERLCAWRRHFGPDRWIEDVEEGAQRWRLVGLDVMLMGSGEPEEDEHARWLEQVMTEAGERRIAWFLHRPLFLEDPGDFSDPSRECGVVELIDHSAEPLFTGHLRLRRADQKARSRRPDIAHALKGEISRFVQMSAGDVPGLTQHWWPPLERANPALRQ